MEKNRLEAFSDGVIAVIITIMVLELKTPQGTDWHALKPLLPGFLAYALSFIYVGIYWNNHHHMLSATKLIGGRVLLANLHFLFWLSFVPWITGWMGQSFEQRQPTIVYGVLLLIVAIAFIILQRSIIRAHPSNSLLKEAVGRDRKGRGSLILYGSAIGFSFWHPWIAQCLYALVAAMWLIPDSRIERIVAEQ